MDAVKEALLALKSAENSISEPGTHVQNLYMNAQAWAAIAQAEATKEQAEQLKRIADALHIEIQNGIVLSLTDIVRAIQRNTDQE